jgi:hypothetical protein
MGAAARSLAVRQHDRRLLATRFTALVEALQCVQPAPADRARWAISGRG